MAKRIGRGGPLRGIVASIHNSSPLTSCGRNLGVLWNEVEALAVHERHLLAITILRVDPEFAVGVRDRGENAVA